MYTFIVNPASCSGRGQKYWELVRQELDSKQVNYRVFFSKGSGDLIRLARELTAPGTAGEEDIHLVILGGDGTVNEVLQGVQDFGRLRFSYIPTGSSNDLARDLGISRDPLAALNAILSDPTEMSMDVGLLHYHTACMPGQEKMQAADRRFLVGCGIGFDAAVCQQALRSRIKDTLNRFGLGKLTYLGIALKTLFASKNTNACLIFPDESGNASEKITLKNLFFVAGMSHCYEGGGFLFCPGADSQDGILDLCTVSNVSKLKVLLVLPTAFFGKHYLFKGVDRHNAPRFRIQSSRPLWVHTDGEVTAMSDDIEVTCCREKLRFFL